MIIEIYVGCVTPKANAPPKGFGALGYAIKQRQSAQVGKPALSGLAPLHTT
ncbi:hypothetical protein LC613_15315 [Nostoc sphaeroides CHAB 2801]|uniref:hypothetical protein n=1 Tax=Nostoc sphaeroides TaxID=446679 RepID=UPI001E2C2C44|nr:hypothetical protein [Nostoc sphaeroides]MCC5629362.1 hypothetical protein [Nostoc sphaeroides CHAB 2801]